MAKSKKRNAIQWLYGETNEIELPVITDKEKEYNEIAVGDPVCVRIGPKNAGNRFRARPASEIAIASAGDCNQMFAGICMSCTRDGDEQKVRVATTGVFEVPHAALTTYAGYFAKWVEGSASMDADACLPAAPTGTYVHAFGTLVDGATTSASAPNTTAKVKIHSRFMNQIASLDTILSKAYAA